jgi:hypothetical protein
LKVVIETHGLVTEDDASGMDKSLPWLWDIPADRQASGKVASLENSILKVALGTASHTANQ